MKHAFKVTKDILAEFMEKRRQKDFSCTSDCIIALTMKPILPDVKVGTYYYLPHGLLWTIEDSENRLPPEVTDYIKMWVGAPDEKLADAPELEFEVEI